MNLKHYFCKHHWHYVRDSEIMIPAKDGKCALVTYLDSDHMIWMEQLNQCCKCGKVKRKINRYITSKSEEDLLKIYPTKRECRNEQ